MAKITIEELSGSLKEYLNGLGLTEAQVQGLIDKFEDEKIGDISQLSTEEKESLVGAINEVNQKANKEVDLSNYQQKTDNSLQTSSKNLVGAINELFQNANNGKELIANAIGEPLDSNDTFSAMSNDINSLLSTFKTNMMNNGVMVESGDKFKSLIDKIKGLTEGGDNKGVQFITGTLGSSNYVSRNMTQTGGNVNSVGCFKIPMPNFEPVLIYAEGRITSQACDTPTIYLNLGRSGGYSFSYRKASNVYYTTCYFYKMDRDSEFLYLQTEGISSSDTFDYYIIGIGEEDTTLRDSLASILTEEGVEVTEEDDMASLISKVDSEFDRKNEEMENNKGLDIISATELPAIGKENQICVITDNPVDSFILTPDKTSNNNTSYITVYTGDSSTPNNVKVELNNNNILQNYYFYRTTQGGTRLASYIYQNNNWTQLTISTAVFYSKGTFYNTKIHGGLYVDSNYLKNEGGVLKEITNAINTYASFNNMIDFSQFNYARISGYVNFENGSIKIYATDAKTNSDSLPGNLLYQSKAHAITTSPTTVTIDISGYNDIAYLTLYLCTSADHVTVNITDIEFY